jgi:hypothetical protein
VLTFDRDAVPLGEVLDRQVESLRAARDASDAGAAELLRAVGGEGAETELTTQTARDAIARDHGYADWSEAREHADVMIDTRFEAAADAIQWGDIAALRGLLDAHPALIAMRSPFPHHCTLLQHVAANGIEVERQLQSPPNATDVMRLLLHRGAEPDAACDLYGGGPGMTTMCLLVSSCVPAVAGVQAALVEVLCAGGAAANGPQDDGKPLKTAVDFGYTPAAEALVRCGARVDNLALCAALGDLNGVRSRFGEDGAGTLIDSAGEAAAMGVPQEHVLEEALGGAALHGRRGVVEFLLGKDPDLSYADPGFGATARGAALYNGHTEIAALIEQRLAQGAEDAHDAG